MSAPKLLARSVATARRAPFRSMGPGFTTAQISMQTLSEKMNPFLHIDHFHMSLPFFRPHPHAGFCPVTFFVEDSEGSFQTRDTIDTNKVVEIKPGELFWSTAGSGLVHEEVPFKPGVDAHGLQMFINLASEHKEMKPFHHLLSASDVPVVTSEDGTRVRVVLGEHESTSSPFKPVTEVGLLEVTIQSGKKFTHKVPAGWNAFLIMMKGKGITGTDAGSAELEASSAVAFENDGDLVEFNAVENCHFVLLSGKPINEPVYSGGPFVGNSPAQIQKFNEAFRSGKMGMLSPSF